MLILLKKYITYMLSGASEFLTLYIKISISEGGVRGGRKPQNRIEKRQKTANRIGFFPEYRNRVYM